MGKSVADRVKHVMCGGTCCKIVATTKLQDKLEKGLLGMLDKTAKEILPLDKIHVEGKIGTSFTKIYVELDYVNTSKDTLCETFFEFPMEDNLTIEGIEVRMNGEAWKKAEIMAEHDVEQIFDKDTEAGKLVVMGKGEVEKKKFEMFIGNLNP